MRIALAMLMVVHGLAHSVGFVGAWHIGPESVPYKTTVLAGRLDLGHAGIRVVGTLWLAAAIAFVLAAIAAVMGVAWWPQLALFVALVSALLSAAELPEARLGLAINVGIIAVLLTGRWLGRI